MFKKLINTEQEIEFNIAPQFQGVYPKPQRSSKFMPDWYKNLPRFLPNQPVGTAGTVKTCVPVMDAITNGYIIPLWADLHLKTVTRKDEDTGKIILGLEHTLALDSGMASPIDQHHFHQVGSECPVTKYKMGRVLLKINNPWQIKTPKGYSVLIKTPPHLYPDLQPMEGVVDTDTYHRPINFPCLWTNNNFGEWVIPRGTPFIHVVPIKRSTLKAKYGTMDEVSDKRQWNMVSSTFSDNYRKFYWNRAKKDKPDA